MKRILIVCLTALSLNAPAQKEIAKKDTAFTDSVAIISVKDLQPIYQELQKLPYQTAKPYIDYLQGLVMLRSKEWEDRRKKSK